jgi:hypothetical protein
MAADLVLIAGPADQEWRDLYTWYRRADYVQGGVIDLLENESIDDEGYIRLTDDDELRGITSEQWEATRTALGLDTLDSFWVGQVSWLKAGLLNDEKYIPAPVHAISAIVGNGKLLTTGVAKELTVALNLPNRSIYRGHSLYQGVVRAQHLKTWLSAHIGTYLVQESQ